VALSQRFNVDPIILAALSQRCNVAPISFGLNLIVIIGSNKNIIFINMIWGHNYGKCLGKT
jgi:hypothetical protein